MSRKKIKKMRERVRVAGKIPAIWFGIPMHREMHGRTLKSLLDLVEDLRWRYGWPVSFRTFMGALPFEARNHICSQGQENKEMTHVLMADDDMVLPPPQPGLDGNVLARMVMRDKPVVGALCTGRLMPITVYVGREVESGASKTILDLEWLLNGECEPVDYIGTGVMCIQRQVIEDLGERWFNHEFAWRTPELRADILQAINGGFKGTGTELGDFVIEIVEKHMATSKQYGEDYSFCKKARRLGHTIWVDKSFEVGHIGDYAYTIRDFVAQQQRMLGEKGIYDAEKPLEGINQEEVDERFRRATEKEPAHA